MGGRYTATQDHSGQQPRRVRARAGIVAAAPREVEKEL
jgi:hypothetical protein